MFSFQFYKVVHILGVLLMFMALGGAAFHSATGGDKTTNPLRKMVASTHGTALLVIFIAGFGAAGVGGFMGGENGFPLWIAAKIVLWLVFGALIVPLNKAKGSGKILWYAMPVLGAISAWLAIYKPF
ncbi:MAG: cytochrome bd-type quinol oxidase subunit 2 [Bradymonadia bacterium]|jgi:cytochrome bd-type quinol oxidase subunit 2